MLRPYILTLDGNEERGTIRGKNRSPFLELLLACFVVLLALMFERIARDRLPDALEQPTIACRKRTNKDRIVCRPVVGTDHWDCAYYCRTYNDDSVACGTYEPFGPVGPQ